MNQSEIEDQISKILNVVGYTNCNPVHGVITSCGKDLLILKDDIKKLIATERRKAVEELAKRVKPLMTTITDQETLDTFLKISLKESEAENE